MPPRRFVIQISLSPPMCAPATPQDLAASLLDLFFNLDGFRVALGNFTHSQGACLFPLYLNLPGLSSSRAETVLTEVRRLTTIVDSLWNERAISWTPRLRDGALHPSPGDPRGTLSCEAGPRGCTIHKNRRKLKSTKFLEANSLGTPLKRKHTASLTSAN